MVVIDDALVCNGDGLQRLVDVLRTDDRDVYGPVIRDGAIVLRAVESVDELPVGWTQTSAPGEVRLDRRDDRLRFGWAVAGQPWKSLLHPARVRTATMTQPAPDQSVAVSVDRGTRRPLALFGVRPCDLAAIDRLDTVLLRRPPEPDPIYAARRAATVIVAVNCNTPASTCFCTSMGTGPHVEGRTTVHDVEITELAAADDVAEPVYVLAPVSDVGVELLARVASDDAGSRGMRAADAARIADAAGQAAQRIDRRLDAPATVTALAAAHDSDRWGEVAERCLACGNCTAVCPTCFCTRLDDVGDLSGRTVDRWRTWESCFSLEFSRLGSAPVRSSLAARYRQWMTHKLSSWHDQFDESGCTGCGRCIAWCPVGIDLMAEGVGFNEEAG